MMSDVDSFKRLYELDISPHVQSMSYGGRSMDYLEWSTAWRLAREAFPDITYQIQWFPGTDGRSLPFLQSPLGVFVQVSVTIRERVETEIYPVTDEKVTAHEIANAHQRALVKCLGRHGLGLKLWETEAREKLSSEHPKQTSPVSSGEYRYSVSKTSRNYGKTFDEIGLPGVMNDVAYWKNRLKMDQKPASGEVKKFLDHAEVWLKSNQSVKQKVSGDSEPPPIDDGDIPF